MAAMRLTHTHLVLAPAERVWALTEDLESWPTLTPTMTSVQRLDAGALRVGSTARVTQPRQRPATWTVTTLEPPRQLTWEAAALGTRLVAGHHVEPVDGGCRTTLTLDLEGGTAPVLSRLAGGTLRSALATENDGFRRAAEGRVRPRFVDEHATLLDVPLRDAWGAVRAWVDRLLVRGEGSRLALLLGAEPRAGFSIVEEEPPHLLGLAGRHRFSRYALDLRLEEAEAGTRVSAVTYADFPGPRGAAYRAAVVGSRGHVLAVRRMLDQIGRSV